MWYVSVYVCVCAVVWNERVMAVALFWWLQTNELQIDAVVSSVCVCVCGVLSSLPSSPKCSALCGCQFVCSTVYEPLNHSTTQHRNPLPSLPCSL